MTTENLVATSLKRFRKKFKLKQSDVASLLGITNNAYQNYEYGKSSPSAVAILKLAKEFNISTDYILGQCDEPYPQRYNENEVKAAFAFRDAWNQFQKVSPQVVAQ